MTRLTFHTKQQFRSSIWKGSEKGAGTIKICSSSYKRDNCTCQDSSLWEGDDLGIPLTGRKGVKGTDRSLFFPKHELGSLAMVLGTTVKRRYFISWWRCTGGMLCQSPAQMEKLMWIPMRDCKYFRDTKTQTTAGSENTLSWEQADTWRVSGHHIHFLYSFPSVVMSEHEILFRQTLVINTHMAILMVISISPAISSYCYLQLLPVSNSRSQGCMKYHPLPWKTYSEYSRSRDNLSAWGQEAKHYILASKQNEYLSWLLAKEGARRYLLYDLKATYLGHLLTDKEICLTWSAVQNSMYCWAEGIPLWAATTHFPCVVWSIWNGVSHDGFVLEVSFPSRDQTQ